MNRCKGVSLIGTAAIALVAIPSLFAHEHAFSRENCETPLNLGEIVQKVSRHPIREGDKIVIKERAYEAYFDEHGVVLKARETKHDARDLHIPMACKPDIGDGKVVYQVEGGEITFEGRSQGLRFEETHQWPTLNSLLTPYSGNVATLENGQVTEWARTGDFLIDTSVVYVPAAPYGQGYPSVAFDGTNYLVVWGDSRCDSDIYGARVNQSGVVLDSAGIVISTGKGGRSCPSVAFHGANYLVIWQDDRRAGYPGYDIYGARVTQSGAVLDPDGIAISTTAIYSYEPVSSVAFDGTNCLVVWGDQRNGNDPDIYGARVDQSAVVLDPDGIAISTAANGQCYPSVAFDGTNYFVVWGDFRSGSDYGIYGARVDQSGNVLDPDGVPISTAPYWQEDPSVAFGGTKYLVVWEDWRREGGATADIYGTRVDQSGIVLDPDGIPISIAVDWQGDPTLAFDGTNYFVVWWDYRTVPNNGDIYGARVDQSGVVLDPDGIPISTAARGHYPSSVAFAGPHYLVVWQDYRTGSDDDIYGARVDQSATVLDPEGIAISFAANSQWSPSVAFDNTNYLVVWQDYSTSSGYDIYGARVDQSGVVLDPDGVAISTPVGHQSVPSVAFDGTNYLVVWEDWRNGLDNADIYGARVDQSGVVLDPDGIPISIAEDDQLCPSIAFDGTNYFVVWQQGLDYLYPGYIYGARVSQSGVVLDPDGILISIAGSRERYPAVAFDGTNYLVVWHHGIGSPFVQGARVDQSGVVLDPDGIAISTPWYFIDLFPSVAFDGTNYLVVWQDGIYYYCTIKGARVDQSGVVLDPDGIKIPSREGGTTHPAVAFDGTDYLVLWDDWHTGPDYDIYGAKLNTSGVVIDSLAVSTQIGRQISPALAHGSGDQLLIAYSGWTDSVNAHPAHTMRIRGKFCPFVGIKEETAFKRPDEGFGLQAYPNPSCGRVNIAYGIAQSPESIELRIYHASGRLIERFDHLAIQPFGRIIWDGTDNSGKKLPSGVYFLKFDAGDSSAVEKLLLVR